MSDIMRLNSLSPAPGSKKNTKRVGRGIGSGTGKICFIASQVVGAEGSVIGIDMTDDMLQVARENAPLVADRIGYANVEFHRGRIQDLALDLCQLGSWPTANESMPAPRSVRSTRQRRSKPSWRNATDSSANRRPRATRSRSAAYSAT